MISPSLELLNEKSSLESDNDERDPVLQKLTKPGTRLIMPSEETQIRTGESTVPRIFDTVRSNVKSRKLSPHEIGAESFGRVFANRLAGRALDDKSPIFPVGSIFVREKFLNENDSVPETVTAVIKREKGFSKKTSGWEFLTFSGADLKLQKRETKGDCAKCHAQAKETDFVFKGYFK
jgi:hypothetical protein